MTISRTVGRAKNLLQRLRPRRLRWQLKRYFAPDEAVITRLMNGAWVRVHPFDALGQDVFVDGAAERAEVMFVERYLRPGMTFLDLGANFGQYTVFAAMKIRPGGRVIAFEPSPRMFGELRFNVRINELENVCNLVQGAVADVEGEATLSRFEPGAEVYGSLGTQHWANAKIVGSDVVRKFTVDNYLAEIGVKRVDLMKIDIEGAELLALKGARHLLEAKDAPTIVVEMADVNAKGFGYSALETWDYLAGLGFCFYSFDDDGRIAGKVQRPPSFDPAQNLVASKTQLS